MRPNALIIRAYSYRGAYLWLGTRALASMGLALAQINPFRLSPVAHLNFVLLSVAVSFMDTRMHRERALLGNLAISPLVLACIFAAPAVAGELALFLIAAMFA